MRVMMNFIYQMKNMIVIDLTGDNEGDDELYLSDEEYDSNSD